MTQDVTLDAQERWRRIIVEHLGPQRMSLYMGKDIDRMATGAVIAEASLAAELTRLRAAHRITAEVYHEETHPSLGAAADCDVWPCNAAPRSWMEGPR